jgi:hypothetical protein
MTCVNDAISKESLQQISASEEKLDAATKAVQEAQKSGDPLAILKTESALAAQQAEKVTGFKPVRMKNTKSRKSALGARK